MSIRPKKSLGQNFLIDNNIIRKIVDSLSIENDDLIIEIGPGKGALTKFIYHKTQNLILVELDNRLINELLHEFPLAKIINQDFLTYKLNNNGEKIKIVGNLPYYISSQILLKIFTLYNEIEFFVFMVQKEFGKRLVALPSTKDYSLMTVVHNLYGNSEKLFDVPRTVFRPQPNVDSAVYKFTPNCKFTVENPNELFQFVKAAFSQRRKKLLNSLDKYINSKLEKKQVIRMMQSEFVSNLLSLRAENLTYQNFLDLFNEIEKHSIEK